MKISINIDEKKLINDIMANYPEYSSLSLRCIDYDYKKCKFEFWDCESTPKNRKKSVVEADIVDKLSLRCVVYTLYMPELRRGLEKVIELMTTGKLPGIARDVMPNIADAGNWDSDAADALVQCAIFGDVIYG